MDDMLFYAAGTYGNEVGSWLPPLFQMTSISQGQLHDGALSTIEAIHTARKMHNC